MLGQVGLLAVKSFMNAYLFRSGERPLPGQWEFSGLRGKLMDSVAPLKGEECERTDGVESWKLGLNSEFHYGIGAAPNKDEVVGRSLYSTMAPRDPRHYIRFAFYLPKANTLLTPKERAGGSSLLCATTLFLCLEWNVSRRRFRA